MDHQKLDDLIQPKPAVLCVDDDANLLSALRRTLRDQPFDLYIAHSSEMAIDMFHRRSFDLVVIDQNMSGMPGTELAAWIAQHFPSSTRIMMTGAADLHVAQDAINRGGVFRFLIKPVRELDLALAILEGLEAGLLSKQVV